MSPLYLPQALASGLISLWDLHWVKQLDDEGFIDSLIPSVAIGAGETCRKNSEVVLSGQALLANRSEGPR